jgi:hypothetical protein
MHTADNVNRAARHLIGVHGNAAEKVARARSESAAGTEQENVAAIWLQIATAVREMQNHTEMSAARVPEPPHGGLFGIPSYMPSGKHRPGTRMANRSKTIIKGSSAHAAPKRQVTAKAERCLAEADKQHARMKADPVREVVRERLRVKRANKERSEA